MHKVMVASTILRPRCSQYKRHISLLVTTVLASSSSNLIATAFIFPTRRTVKSKTRLQTSKAKLGDDGTTMSNPVVPHNIDPRTLQQLVEYATSFSAANGLQVEVRDETKGGKNPSYITAPISLLPQSYPSSQFERAKSLAAPFNELVDRISRDGSFLQETLKDVRDVDEYTGKLLDLYEEIYLGECEN